MFGFTFAYGSMFAKVWIVHRMGASENQELAAIAKDEVGRRIFSIVIIYCTGQHNE